MRLRFLLPSVIFLFSGVVAHGQIRNMLYQGFEDGETSHIAVTPSSSESYSTTLYSSGARSLEVVQDVQDVEVILDTLDFTNDQTVRYLTLEFDHICKLQRNSSADVNMGKIYFKRANQSDWTLAGSMYYNMTNGGTSSFQRLSSFSVYSYDEWNVSGTTNDMWRSERFDFNNALPGTLAASERKVIIKFVVRQKANASAASGKWHLDNIKVTASSDPMVRPVIKMACYPDGIIHPNSRGARIALDATTSVAAGVNPDSVYLFFRGGSDPTPVKLSMVQSATRPTRYEANIPFYGYDTMMSFYCVARDATSNANMARFPQQEGGWIEYKCVRGGEQPGLQTPGFTGTSSVSYFPFRATADGRSEWVYDSAMMANAGYGPGTITSLRYTVGAHTNNVTRPRFQIRMKNAPSDYTVDTSLTDNYPFTQSYMHVVYDSAYTVQEMNTGGEQTIQFQEPFYYAGKDLVMSILYDGNVDVTSTSIKMVPVHPQKKTIWFNGGDADFQLDGITGIPIANSTAQVRPAFVMTEQKNLPLLHDLGISALVSPSYETPMTQGVGELTVRLKNFGAMPVNGVRITWLVDDTLTGYYDWTGTLAANATQDVLIANNVNIFAGFHTLKVWVEDTLTVGTDHLRDHEPFNDTCFSEFIVCDGPMHGVRQIGGAGADFNTMRELLFALSRCGVDDSLVVKLAPGEYAPFVMPQVSGVSASHYVVFEPLTNGVKFVAEATSGATEIVNLEMVSNVRFRNIDFVRRSASADEVVLSDMVKLGITSVNCRFESCRFIDSVDNPSAMLRINSMLNSGFANSLLVDGCTFIGGKVGVDLRGMASDVRSVNNTVKNSLFRNQYESALSVQNQTNVVVEKNEMYDVISSTSYVLLMNECYGTSRVTANKLYTSHGAGAMGVSKAIGTSTNRFLIANNMIVCEDDGTSLLMRSPMNIIQATYADVVYNSVKMTAATRTNSAAVTFGGGVLQNSRFLNNIVVCLDNTNYALNYEPLGETSNIVGHNIYYSMGMTMNRKSGGRYVDMAEWITTEPNDTASVKVNPNFLNGSLVDLRTFNRQVKGVGIPLASVPTDMFDTLRSTTATCPGAFEFVSLGYDFEPEALLSPELETCNMPSQVELVLRVRNNGTSVYNGSGLSLAYQVNGGTVSTRPVTQTVPADDTVTIHTGAMLSLPANGTADALYSLKVWTVYNGDPNATNDTTIFLIKSKYHPAAPSNVNEQIQYATRATLTPVAGVDEWSVYDNASAPMRQSQLYWYHSLQDAEPFYVGPTLVTDTLRQDTSFYFRQKRSQPIVRITQLEIKRGGSGTNATVGETPNAPFWLNSSRKVALQLTNVGDERACLYGDTLVTVSPTSGINNKIYRFNDSVFLEPGQSLVMQYVTGTSASPANTLFTGLSFTVSYNSNIAFLYKHDGAIEDAVVLNTVANHNAPAYVWNGAGVNMTTSNTSAGIVRTAFAGGASDWRIATNAEPMMLNSTDENWIRYTDNGCDGDFAMANVTLLAPPVADIEVGVPQLPAAGCGMGLEEVSVQVRNYGSQPVTSLVMNYSAAGNTVSETLPVSLGANSGMTYTFTTPLNLAFPQDTTITVTVWANAVTGDPVQQNDTNRASVTTLYTPAAPAAMPTRTVQYADRDTVTDFPGAGVIPVWYDYQGVAVDTGYTHVTDILYANGTMGVSHMVYSTHQVQVGTGTTTNGNTAFPSPYQPGNKYAKQQYIYSASELRAMGLEPGYIDSIAFDLTQFVGNNAPASISFNDYYVSMGLTQDTIFATTSAWKSTTEVFHRSPLTIYATDCNNWVPLRFDTPFYWDGESSVVVQLVHYIATKVTSGVKSTYTTKTNSTLHKNGDSDLSPSTMEYVGAGTRGSNRPNIRFFNSVFGCEGPITPYQVQLVNIPAVDVAIMWPDGIDTVDRNSCGSLPFYVKLRNQGANDISSMKLYYILDTLPMDSVQVTGLIEPGEVTQTLLLNSPMVPGRHKLTAVAAAAGDNITTNDTINLSFVVRFCGGNYTIAPANGDYRSFGEAIDTLNVVGIEGPVTFNVMNATYAEQVILNNIPGASAVNTIAFVGEGDSVLLTAATSQNDNYVFLLDSAFNVTLRNIAIEARPTVNSVTYANALVINKGGHVTIDSCRIKVKGTINNLNASCVVLGPNVTDLTFTRNVIDSGFYSIKANGTGYQNIVITNNRLTNFWKMGVNLRDVTNLQIGSNRITSGVSVASRGLRGLYLAQVSGDFSVVKNHIYLIDQKTGGKLGIQLENVSCVSSNPGLVANNMISCFGTGTADLSGLKPAGIWIDSSSSNIGVYYNTVRVECGNVGAAVTYNEATAAFYSGATVSNILVMNNIFSNYQKGYAYYVSELNTVNISNFNAYYTESVRPFFWKQFRTSMAELQNANTDDANSVFDQPYFESVDDLHLVMTNFVSLAQYLADPVDDIDGTRRYEIPAPTIGAHEMEINTHDMTIVEVLSPYVPTDTNFVYPNKMPVNIEGDSVLVKVRFYNNGRSIENNVHWYAYIEGDSAVTRTVTRDLGSFNAAQMKLDSVMMPTALGIINRHTVRVVLEIPNDNAPEDNERTAEVFLAPAYNFQVTGTSTASTDGCGRRNTILQISVKNVGFKDMPAGMPVNIGFHPQITQPANTTVATMPDTVRQDNIPLPNTLLCNQTVVLAMPYPVNLYPTGLAVNLKVKLWGWCHNDLDVSPQNDTTTNAGAVVINSYYTPAAPVGFDTTLAYGVWGGVRAMQENSRPIRWYRDSTAATFYHPTQYAASCRWNTTPQYFHDTTYYLNCLSDQNCPSYFSPVTVHVAPRIPNDMAMKEVLAPLGERVYMQNDTVRVKVSNFGTSPQTNIPITYQLKRGTTIVQTVTETITATVPAGQDYIFTFDSLLNITTPTTTQNYSLNIWTDLSTDGTRRNDTLRTPYTFRSLAESTYDYTYSSNPTFDITRASFNEFDFDCPALGRGITNLASFNSPDYPVVHVTRGTADSLIVQVTLLDGNAQPERVLVWALIDFNRNGVFEPELGEEVVSGSAIYDNATFASLVHISNSASYGYMRMRIAVGSYADFSGSFSPTNGFPTSSSSHFIDFLLFVDPEPLAKDLAVTQIVSPRSYLIRDDAPRVISFRIANKGASPISNPQFTYYFQTDTTTLPAIHTINYSGTLQPGTSAVLSLPEHVFPYGVTTLNISHHLEGDLNPDNNTLVYEYNRFHIITLILDDNFDSDNKWYAPTGYNAYSRNYWELGYPSKAKLNAPYSDSNAWVTDLDASIVSGKRGNVSYLYSPIINIGQVKADTISFYLRRNLTNGSSFYVEFNNFAGRWVKVDWDSASNWYNNADDRVFDGTTAGSSYTRYWIPTRSSRISGDFPQYLQFRLVYSTPIGTSTTAAFGEGCAVDNFRIGRAPILKDGGVVAVTHPTAPSYGETIYPKVLVHNYGLDTIREAIVAYTHYGTWMPKEDTITSLRIAPGAEDTISFTTPFIVTSDYPDTFCINAFTKIDGDIYRDNDTLCQCFALSPLENDISAHSFLYPLTHVIAGDTTVQVTMRIRNFGRNPLSRAIASYLVNGRDRVDEEIDFVELLGEPLQSMQYYNYTFQHHIRATMGIMQLMGIIKSDSNDYIYNDTITKRIEGISAVNDIAAVAMIVDSSDFNAVRFELVIENRGARGANGFEVGFYIDNSTDTIYRETYGREQPLPALTTGYHMFDVALPRRAAPYSTVRGFVHYPGGDNDPSNDTTSATTSFLLDIEPLKVIVEETAQPDCRVFIDLRNNGNLSLLPNAPLQLRATINGTRCDTVLPHRIEPGQTVRIELSGRVPKSPTRTYTGTGRLTLGSDGNTENNQTSVVEVVNYVEGVPTVENPQLSLEQNFPNPFSQSTTVPFSLPESGNVRFFVIDALGHIVNSFSRYYSAGEHSIVLNMEAYSSGIYYYGIEVNGQRQMKKMILK